MFSPTSPQPSHYARCRASPFKRLRIQIDSQRDVQRSRRIVIAVPSTFQLVTDLASHLHERFASTVSLQSPLRLSVDGYALPAAQPLHFLIREDDVLTVREATDGVEYENVIVTPMTPVAKRCRIADIDVNSGSIKRHDCPEEKVDGAGLISSAEAVARARKQLAARNGVANFKNSHDSNDAETKAAALKAAKAAALAQASAALMLATSVRTNATLDTPVEEGLAKPDACVEQLEQETIGLDSCQESEVMQPTQETSRLDNCQESEGTPPTQESKECRVFVGGLPWACTADALHKDFSECGKIVDMKIMEDKETGRSRGFAFVTFADEAGLEAALKYDGDEYGGRTLKVNRTDAKGKSKGKGKRKK